MSKPKFIHDCDHCIFLQSVYYDNGWHDLYKCVGQKYDTLISRYSDEGSEYASLDYRYITPLSDIGLQIAQVIIDRESGACGLTENGLLMDKEHNTIRKINPWS